MKTYTIDGYVPWGTDSGYVIDVKYRGEIIASFSGPNACEQALRYVSRHAGRAVVNMGDK